MASPGFASAFAFLRLLTSNNMQLLPSQNNHYSNTPSLFPSLSYFLVKSQQLHHITQKRKQYPGRFRFQFQKVHATNNFLEYAECNIYIYIEKCRERDGGWRVSYLAAIVCVLGTAATLIFLEDKSKTGRHNPSSPIPSV
ncbi:hypothetical protein F2P56_033988 [Juglans regia]|uniref:Uncharacterized protein n=1 Tax=Juglans regia TaxID=51240 RepID=A0A833WVP0_JUGRE|nr:hypothetical protein F2P56_033988 [Juglans regia]